MRKKIIFIAIVAAILGAVMLWSPKNSSSLSVVKCQLSNVDCPWYAVYLGNNQVYFGHIASVTDSTITLADAYFLEVYQEPAPKASSENFALEQPPQQAFRLIRRGDEKILSSDHTLFINRTAVLYWEKLTSESEVAKLIKANQK